MIIEYDIVLLTAHFTNGNIKEAGGNGLTFGQFINIGNARRKKTILVCSFT